MYLTCTHINVMLVDISFHTAIDPTGKFKVFTVLSKAFKLCISSKFHLQEHVLLFNMI